MQESLAETEEKALTDWLRSDWLETNALLAFPPFASLLAYRLASIGLVGNDSPSFCCAVFAAALTDWLRSDWLETLFVTFGQIRF